MFWPLFLGLLGILVGLMLHAVIASWAEDQRTSPGRVLVGRKRLVLGRVIAVLLAIGVAASVFAAATVFQVSPSRFVSLATPLSAMAAVLAFGYAIHLYDRFLLRHRHDSRVHLEALRRMGASVGLTMLFLTAFWTVSHYAAIKGVDLALEVDRGLSALPDVTLYSAKRLYLQAPVRESELGDPTAAYRFSYAGLKFLFLTNHRYFLRPSDPHASTVNLIIADGPDVRIELSPP